MDEFDQMMREVQAETALCWQLTPALLAAFGPEDGQCDADVYEAAFHAAARDVSTQVMLETWALMLWPTLTSDVDATSMGELLRAQQDRSWLVPSGALLRTAASYVLNPVSDRFLDLIAVYRDQVAPACSSHVELWECCWHWALHLYQTTTAAGSFELIDVLTDQHRKWSGDQPDVMLAPALALVIGSRSVGDHATARTYLSGIVARGAQLRELASIWLTALSRLVPENGLDEVIVAESDGTLFSMGSVEEIDGDEELRTIAVLTRDLVSAVQRGDQAAVDSAESQVVALPAQTAFRWVWLLSGMVGSGIAQITMRRGRTP